jgi:hypothetical protein
MEKKKKRNMTYPKKIFLTAGDEDESLVWCEDKITDDDIEYVRIDILKKAIKFLVNKWIEQALKVNQI